MKFLCTLLLIAPFVLMLGCGESSDVSQTGQTTEAKVSLEKSSGCSAECASACASAAKPECDACPNAAKCSAACAKSGDHACGSASANPFPHEALLTDFAGCCESAKAGEKTDACCSGPASKDCEKTGCCGSAGADDACKTRCCAKCTCAPGACGRADGGTPCAEGCAHAAAEGRGCKQGDKCSKSCPKHGKQI